MKNEINKQLTRELIHQQAVNVVGTLEALAKGEGVPFESVAFFFLGAFHISASGRQDRVVHELQILRSETAQRRESSQPTKMGARSRSRMRSPQGYNNGIKARLIQLIREGNNTSELVWNGMRGEYTFKQMRDCINNSARDGSIIDHGPTGDKFYSDPEDRHHPATNRSFSLANKDSATAIA